MTLILLMPHFSLGIFLLGCLFTNLTTDGAVVGILFRRPNQEQVCFQSLINVYKKITEEYMTRAKPPSLFIYGSDAKRNSWNSKHYSRYDVGKEYVFKLIKNTHSFKGNNENIVGVAWVRKNLPEIKPGNFIFANDYLVNPS